MPSTNVSKRQARQAASKVLAELRRVDRQVATRIMHARILRGLGRRDFADRMGVGYQNLYNIETGRTRVTSGRLMQVAQLLGVPMGWFFEAAGPAELAGIAGGVAAEAMAEA